MKTYESRVRKLEAEGLTRSDAQGAIDAEDMKAKIKVQHTSLPWEVRVGDMIYKGSRRIADCEITDKDNRPAPLLPEDAANAAFIVKACNSHYELLEACKAMLLAIEGPACCTALDANGNNAWPNINKAASLIRDAVSKAKAP